MKLKRINQVFSYRDISINDFILLRDFSIHNFYKSVYNQEQEVEALYHMNTSHTTDDENGLITVVKRVESIVIEIDERKAALQRYKKDFQDRYDVLRSATRKYSFEESDQISAFFESGGEYRPIIIDKLLHDIDKIVAPQRKRRQEKQNEIGEKVFEAYIEQMKMKEVVTI